MSVTYYVVFESIDDPRHEKIREIHDSRWKAEGAQLMRQQDAADAFNKARAKAFKAGRAFPERKTAADYSYRFRIEEVS
jgi:hypothetical protein